jgi:hypothetical protein
VLVSVLFSQLLLVKVYEEEGHTAQQDAGGTESNNFVCKRNIAFFNVTPH